MDISKSYIHVLSGGIAHRENWTDCSIVAIRRVSIVVSVVILEHTADVSKVETISVNALDWLDPACGKGIASDKNPVIFDDNI